MKTARKGRQSAYISIRSKLVAAVAMLLVASFMVVSSSYAWFTLSTAPEVKGITTTVGSNGNLEIALYTGGTIAQSGIGDAGKNETWGNLINLAGTSSTYGLELINLYPTRLNVAGKTIVQSSPLMTPKYAADGRVEALEETTIFGTYNAEQKQFMEYDPENALGTDGETVVQTSNGVRGIGNSTGLTPQQNDYRIAQSAISSAKLSARTFAIQALELAGSDLATIAADRVNGGVGSYDLTNVGHMLTTLDKAREQIDTMMLSYIKTQVAHNQENETAENYNAFKTSFYVDVNEISDTTWSGWISAYADDNGVLNSVWAYRSSIKSAIDTSLGKFNSLKGTGEEGAVDGTKTATWEQTQNILAGLVDLNAVTINNFTIDQLKETDENGTYVNMGAVAGSVASGVNVVLTGTDGVYIDIANLCGNVETTITIDINVAGINIPGLAAKMKTAVSPAPSADLVTVVPEEPAKGDTEDAAILDSLYGYALDLAFRTNAADSKLKLQSTPTNRIYAGDTNEATMGYGSCMVFNYTPVFGAAQVTNLMKSVRVVFADKDGGIYAVAGLDTASATVLDAQSAVHAPLKLYDATSYTIDKTNGFKAVNTGLKFVSEDKAEITALNQNQTLNLTAYVYLDGDSVDNSSVAAYGAVRGQLNLQFSSTATLVPMDYNPLKTPATTESNNNQGSGEVQEPENGENP